MWDVPLNIKNFNVDLQMDNGNLKYTFWEYVQNLPGTKMCYTVDD